MDSSPQKKSRRDDRSGARVTHAEWTLTPEAFAKLLAAFSSDEDEASRLYLSTHLKLVRFFEWHSCRDPEHHVDVTFNRVARKLADGHEITNLIGFTWGVAHLVFMESLKPPDRLPLEYAESVVTEKTSEPDMREQRLACLDQCLAELTPQNRALIVEYYHHEQKAKEVRQRLANALGIPLNALRIRAHRIRIELEKCLQNCVHEAAYAK